MVTLKYTRTMKEECIRIAASSIDAISDFRTSRLPNQMHRHTCVTFLAAAIIPLICIIVQESSRRATCKEAAGTFKKALGILREIAPGYVLADFMLRRLSPAISVATQALEQLNLHPSQVRGLNAGGETDVDQLWLDLCKDFSRPLDHGSVNYGTQTTMDNSMKGVDVPVIDMTESDIFASDSDFQIDWTRPFPTI